MVLTVFLEESRCHFGERSSCVGAQTLWRFISNLHTVLKDTDGEMFGRHRGEEESEVVVNVFWIFRHGFHEIFHGYHPTSSQVTILEKF